MKLHHKPRFISYLLLGIVITFMATTVTLSRYMSNVSGDGTVTVATYKTEISTLSFTLTNLNKPNTSEKLKFNISNFNGAMVSDVNQIYSITINTTDNMPFVYELQCINTGGNGIGINSIKSEITIGTRINGGELIHGVFTTHEYELTVLWPSDNKNISLSEELELITVVIESEQKID